MEIGIAFPKVVPANKGDILVEWAVRADEGPFSSLAQIDRLVYGNHDVLIAMAAAAAVTRRVRLMPTVLIAPLRNAAIMAKQVASIDSISGGRFVLGLGVGSRPDDFVAAEAQMKARGRRFEEQIAAMRRIWAGEPLQEDVGPIGPTAAYGKGPELLIGGRTEVALRRSGRLGDGYIAGKRGKCGFQPGAGGDGLLPCRGGCMERGGQAGQTEAGRRAHVRLGTSTPQPGRRNRYAPTTRSAARPRGRWR